MKYLKIYENYDFKDLYGFPEFFKGMVNIYNNPVNEIIELIQNYYVGSYDLNDITNKFIYLLNDEKVIRNGNTIIQDRLEEALFGIGIHKLNKTEFKNYKLV